MSYKHYPRYPYRETRDEEDGEILQITVLETSGTVSWSFFPLLLLSAFLRSSSIAFRAVYWGRLLFNFLNLIYVHVPVCMCVCIPCVLCPWKSKGIGCDSCESFDVGAGTQFQSSAKAISTLTTEPALQTWGRVSKLNPELALSVRLANQLDPGFLIATSPVGITVSAVPFVFIGESLMVARQAHYPLCPFSSPSSFSYPFI